MFYLLDFNTKVILDSRDTYEEACKRAKELVDTEDKDVDVLELVAECRKGPYFKSEKKDNLPLPVIPYIYPTIYPNYPVYPQEPYITWSW